MNNGLDSTFNGQIFRKDHPMVLATNRQLATIFGIRLEYNANGYPAGQVLSKDTSDGLFKKYSLASGTYPAQCILFENIDGPASSGTALARGIFGGLVFTGILTDYSAQAKADLSAKDLSASDGVGVTKF